MDILYPKAEFPNGGNFQTCGFQLQLLLALPGNLSLAPVAILVSKMILFSQVFSSMKCILQYKGIFSFFPNVFLTFMPI